MPNLDYEFMERLDRLSDRRICDLTKPLLQLYLVNEMDESDRLTAENKALKDGVFTFQYAEQLREEGRAEMQERYKEVIAAAREVLDLWRRVHGDAMIGRPAITRLRRAISPA